MPTRPLPRLLGSALIGYLAGSFTSADVAARLAAQGEVDLRAAGSGNPGAVNVMAVLGRGWGYAVLGADIAKGALACMAGRKVAGDNGAHVAGVGAVVGHCYPVWKRFRGGKGVATSSGQCLATFPAYFPLDLVVAGMAVAPKWRNRAFFAAGASAVAWVLAGLLWWRRGWPNLWGPPPGPGLPLAAALSSAVILIRFATAASPREAAR